MQKLMIKCPKTGKEVFTGIKIETQLKKFTITVFGQRLIVKCPHCEDEHFVSKEERFLVPC